MIGVGQLDLTADRLQILRRERALDGRLRADIHKHRRLHRTVRRRERAAARMAVFANQLKHSLLAFLLGLPTYSNRLPHQVKRSRQICVSMYRRFLHVLFQRFQPQHHGNAEHKPEDVKIGKRHRMLRHLQCRRTGNDCVERAEHHISYIRTKQGFLYLSIIRDLYDNSIVAYKTGSEQSTKLVLDTIRSAKRKEKVTAELQLHSDQGFQYTSQAYFKLTQQYGMTPSMSRRGNPYDNAFAENFFSILKTECIYRTKIATLSQAKELIDDYIFFYNNQRIQSKTKLTPLELRRQYVA